MVICSVDYSVEAKTRKIYARSNVLVQSDHRHRGSGDVETRAIYRFRASASGLDCIASLDTRQPYCLNYKSNGADWSQATLGLMNIMQSIIVKLVRFTCTPHEHPSIHSERNGSKRPLDLKSTSSSCRHVNIVCTVFTQAIACEDASPAY